MRSLGWGLLHDDWRTYKKRKSGLVQKDEDVKIQGKSNLKLRRKASGETAGSQIPGLHNCVKILII